MKKLILVTVMIGAAIALVGMFHGRPAVACETQVCGNGKVEPGEQCDDGNRNDEDSCSNKCQKQIIKEVIREVPVEKIVEKEVVKEVIVEKEVPVEKLITVEKVVEVPVEKIVKKIVYRDKHDKDKDHKKVSGEKKTLPKTGLPLGGLAAITLSTAGAYGAFRKFRK